MNITLQKSSKSADLPSEADFSNWVNAVFPELTLLGSAARKRKSVNSSDAELCIRVVDEEESQQLNRQYRGKDAPTNVLSFPADIPEELELDILGDLVICAPVVEQEATEQLKPKQAHWAHLVVHGVLHLYGYDHESESEAETMENIEIAILESLGFNNPYVEVSANANSGTM